MRIDGGDVDGNGDDDDDDDFDDYVDVDDDDANGDGDGDCCGRNNGSALFGNVYAERKLDRGETWIETDTQSHTNRLYVYYFGPSELRNGIGPNRMVQRTYVRVGRSSFRIRIVSIYFPEEVECVLFNYLTIVIDVLESVSVIRTTTGFVWRNV